jgi:hypothetical protein
MYKSDDKIHLEIYRKEREAQDKKYKSYKEYRNRSDK